MTCTEDPDHLGKRIGYRVMQQEDALIAALEATTEVEQAAI